MITMLANVSVKFGALFVMACSSLRKKLMQPLTERATKTIWTDIYNYITYPGDMRFEDLNNTGTIDNGANTVDSPGDRKVIGNTEPRYIYTISLSADWNNFFLSAMFDGVGKQNWYPSGESSFWGQYNRPYNQVPLWHLNNYWTKDRPDAYLPRYSGYYNPLYKGTANTRYLQDVSYFPA